MQIRLNRLAPVCPLGSAKQPFEDFAAGEAALVALRKPEDCLRVIDQRVAEAGIKADSPDR